ncbi:MAG: helix-turn-helix domain-containing protein [Candidatus Anammoxibacter sp.]
MRTKKCPICSNGIKIIETDYKSKKIDKDTQEKIVVKNVKLYSCQNKKCQHTWLPSREEERIRSVIRKRTRHLLIPEEVKMIREALLPGMTKMEAADLFNLNTKAFIKWEQEGKYTTPSAAFDLLLRLVAYKEDNLEFIKRLHKKDFAFDLEDYEFFGGKYSIKNKVCITSSKLEVSVDTNVNKFPDSADERCQDVDYPVAETTNQEVFDNATTGLELAA